MSFSRSNPSPRYSSLLAMYGQLHQHGETQLGLPAEQTFNGMSLSSQVARIKALVERTSANTLLDYGCGKGVLYEARPFKAPDGISYDSIVDYWDVVAVHCYDPCYAPYSRVPEGRFDGVLSTDVLEHCPEEDVPWILEEIFGYAEQFVYANVASYPARKHLPNGENAHCTIKPTAWWDDVLRATSARHPDVIYEVWVQTKIEGESGGQTLKEEVIRG